MSNLKNKPITLISFIVFAFLSVLWWLGYTNIHTEKSHEDLPSFSLNELSKLNTGDPLSVTGFIQEVFTSKEGIFIVSLYDESGEITVYMFPSYGTLKEELKIGDKIQVQGILSKYKEQYQIQPFSKQSIKLLQRNTEHIKLPKVSLPNLKDYKREKVLIGPVQIEEVQSFTSNTGKVHIRFQLNENGMSVGAIMFDGEWSKEDLIILEQSQSISVIATVDEYNGTLSLIIHEVYQEKETENTSIGIKEGEKERDTNFLTLSQVDDYVGETVMIGPVNFSNLYEFTSNAGKEHIRFKVIQDEIMVDAIMFEGDWSKREISIIKSSQQYYISAKVDEYNNATSLIVEQIKE